MALRKKLKKKIQKVEEKIEKKLEKLEQKEEEKKQPDGFNSYYLFITKGPIILKHAFETNIRAKPGSPEAADDKGGDGQYAQFEVDTLDNGKEARFKNVKTGKYLRIIGDKVDIGGGEGPFTKFKVHRLSIGYVKLESVKSPGKFIAVTKDKGVHVGKGGPWCRLLCLKKGKKEPFMKPYRFAIKNTCVLETKFGKHLRVKNAKSDELEPDGGKGIFAQWEIEPSHGGKEVKLKNKANGKYLRIQHFPLRKKWDINAGGAGGAACEFKVHVADAVNYVRLESKKHGGRFVQIAIGGKKVVIGEGKIKTRLDLFCVYHD